jgi:hypothetical protein
MHWWRQRGPGWRRSLLLNGVGATATGAAIAVVVVTKFVEGAWLSAVLVAGFMLVFRRVRGYQTALDRRLGVDMRLDFHGRDAPLVVVPLRRLDRLAAKALRFASQLSAEVQALHVEAPGEPDSDLASRWSELVQAPARDAGVTPPRLVTLVSELREFVGPVVEYVHALARHREVVVVVPEIVPRRWFLHLLHGHRATLLKAALLWRGGPNVVVATTPWHE